MSSQPRASGYFRTSYAQDIALAQTRMQRGSAFVFVIVLLGFPFVASNFYLDLVSQVFLASIGSLSLMLLTGYAGLISLGHAGLLCAGAFTAGILFKEFNTPIWLTLPAAAVTGALLGVIFGLPSLRLRGLYLAVSTLAQTAPRRINVRLHDSARGWANNFIFNSLMAANDCRLRMAWPLKLVYRTHRGRWPSPA